MHFDKRVASVKKSLAIFGRDIKRLFSNPVAIIVTIGVCAIPSLYAWYNIVANWDPYGNTASIKIAIANNDQGTNNEYTGELNAGQKVVDQLKDNDKLGWTFVDSSSKAKEMVESGECYAALVIPKNFSENLTSMLSGTFHQPKITYYVNEKKSAIAPKVTDTGANTIEQTINETFVETVTETMLNMAKDAGYDVQDGAADAQNGVTGSVNDAANTVKQLKDTLNGMDGTINSTKESIDKADSTLSSLQGEVPKLNDVLSKGDGMLSATRESAQQFQTSLSGALSSSMAKAGNLSGQANELVGKAASTVTEATSALDSAQQRIQSVIDGNNAVIDVLNGILDLKKQVEGTPDDGLDDDFFNSRIPAHIQQIEQQNAKLQQLIDNLSAQSADIQDDADAINNAGNDINGTIQNSLGTLGDSLDNLNSNIAPQVSSGLDQFSSISGDLTGVVSSLTPTISNARGTLTQLKSVLDQAKTSIGTGSDQLQDIIDKLGNVSDDIAAIRTSEAVDELAKALGVDVDDMADFMKSPVNLKTVSLYPVGSFGMGIAPFYTNLALWVGGYVLIAIYKLEVDHEGVGEFTAKEGYFGRWFLLVLLGAAQALIVCIGDLVLGVQCVSPVLFVLAGVWISFTYVNIIYALSIAFKHIGKAIGVILVIVQIPGSSGMYPIEMMPAFFRWLHPLLPFTYGINAMRETIGGFYGHNYIINLGILCIFIAIALFIGLGLRPLLLNLNLLFDRELATTGLMICEKNGMPNQRYSLRTAMRVLLDAKTYREELVERAQEFEHRYPVYIRAGFAAIIGVQLLLFILSSALDLDNNGHIVLLVIWIIAIILIATWIVNIEYMRTSLQEQRRVLAMSDDDLKSTMRANTTAIPAARKMFGLGKNEQQADDAAAEAEHSDARYDAFMNAESAERGSGHGGNVDGGDAAVESAPEAEGTAPAADDASGDSAQTGDLSAASEEAAQTTETEALQADAAETAELEPQEADAAADAPASEGGEA